MPDPIIFAAELVDAGAAPNSASNRTMAHMDRDREKRNEDARRQRFADRFQLLVGSFRDLVELEVRKVFQKQDLAALVIKLADTHLNVFRYVVDEIGLFPGADRKFIAQDGEPDPVFEAVKELVHFDLYGGEFARGLVAMNDVLVQVLPGVVSPGAVGLPGVRIFYPHEVTVTSDPAEPGVAIEVRYDVDDPAAQGRRVTVVWTKDEHYEVVDGRGRRAVAGASDQLNPYGRLPFVSLHNGLRGDFFWDTDTGEDRVNFHLAYLRQWTAIAFLMHQQGSLQIWRQVDDQNTAPLAYLGPGTEIQVLRGAQVGVLNLQSSPMLQVEALHHALAEHLAQDGLNPEDLGINPGQSPPSGVARAIQRRRLEDRRRRLRPFLELGEKAFAELYRWAYNFNRRSNDQIDPDARFDVCLADEPIIESAKEKAQAKVFQFEVYDWEQRLGFRTRAEQIAEYLGIELAAAQKRADEIEPRPQATPNPAEAPAPPDSSKEVT